MGRASRGRRRPKKGTYWDGLQFPATALTTAGVVFELIGPVSQEFMPATLVRIRGHLSVRSFHATTNVRVGMKIMYVEVNDAGSMTGDHSAFDTHEEDIAVRQIYTKVLEMPPLDELGDNIMNWEVDVKSQISLASSGKQILALLGEADVNSAANMSGYLRCLLLHG